MNGQIAKALKEGKNFISYVWPYKQEDGRIDYHTYEIDLKDMRQTNVTNGTVRAIRECSLALAEDQRTIWQFVADNRDSKQPVWQDMDEKDSNYLTHRSAQGDTFFQEEDPGRWGANIYDYKLKGDMVQINRRTRVERAIRPVQIMTK